MEEGHNHSDDSENNYLVAIEAIRLSHFSRIPLSAFILVLTANDWVGRKCLRAATGSKSIERVVQGLHWEEQSQRTPVQLDKPKSFVELFSLRCFCINKEANDAKTFIQ